MKTSSSSSPSTRMGKYRKVSQMDFIQSAGWCKHLKSKASDRQQDMEERQKFNVTSRWGEFVITRSGRRCAVVDLHARYPASWEVDTKVYDYLAGKESKNPDFVNWNITPSGKWNYAIRNADLDRSNSSDKRQGLFDLDNVPLRSSPVTGVRTGTSMSFEQTV